ncbi:helix-turn-helix transcriptional regulator [Acidiferrobacter thiooxydans]
MRYTSLAGIETDRVIWPVALAFFEGVQLVAAWCELRSDFRHFRVDCVASLETLGIPYPRTRRDHARQWEQARASEGRGRDADYSAPPAQIRTGAANASNVVRNI